mmetsp:Transcript_11614/g.30243  ORF Transcript_11614/g.30243 Transcript_11614/m.30243 type:complete len:215 (+) Transcript_11614:283-927(+)
MRAGTQRPQHPSSSRTAWPPRLGHVRTSTRSWCSCGTGHAHGRKARGLRARTIFSSGARASACPSSSGWAPSSARSPSSAACRCSRRGARTCCRACSAASPTHTRLMTRLATSASPKWRRTSLMLSSPTALSCRVGLRDDAQARVSQRVRSVAASQQLRCHCINIIGGIVHCIANVNPAAHWLALYVHHYCQSHALSWALPQHNLRASRPQYYY